MLIGFALGALGDELHGPWISCFRKFDRFLCNAPCIRCVRGAVKRKQLAFQMRGDEIALWSAVRVA